ncbi:MAG: sugar kinase [Pseudomonadota bacterium]
MSSERRIVIIGEILVEIMADTIGEGFNDPLPLTGPYPSGAPAIFADQVGKLRHSVGIISCVGDDDFGRLNQKRLEEDGVNISGIDVDKDRPTGTAFVRYRKNGSRDFVFNIKHSACGHLHLTPGAKKQIDEAEHLHVMGSSLSSQEFMDLNIKTATDIKARGGTVSFDPNIRKEILSTAGTAESMQAILGMTDLFLPSGDELTMLTQADEASTAVDELLGMGVRAIVHKHGAEGATYHDADGPISVPPFTVDEIDPTGAGDCFGGAFTTFWLRGEAPSDALKMAAAAGALAVTERGPMEGTSDLSQIHNFIRANAKAS